MRTVGHTLRRWGRSVLALVTESQERRAIRMLRAFDNRTLADIGITRGDIEFAVRHGHPSEWNGPTTSEARVTAKARKRIPPLHIFLLLACVPFGGLLSFAGLPSAPAPTELFMKESSMRDEWRTVYDFWFPQGLDEAHALIHRQMFEWWFGGGSNASLAKFVPLVEAASEGRLNHWLKTPRGRLSLILVLDQFPRGLFAGTPKAFASDAEALRIAEEGLRIGHYDALKQPWEKTFFIIPLGHAEGPRHLERLELAAALADQIARNAPEPLKPLYQFSAGQPRGHHDVISRFGRYPHRNAVLGRESTAEEEAYLAKGEFVHKRRPPGQGHAATEGNARGAVQ
jgi:uncharacterized protein (DUF924 family)/uncharacterized protein YjiS (DUF1127 family)